MNVAILSNVTTSLLEGFLKKEHKIWSPSGFGAWMETALNPPSDMVAFAPEAIYILLDGHFDANRIVAEDVAMAAKALNATFPKIPVIVPDIARMAADLGEGFYDAKMWKVGAMPWSLKGMKELKKVFDVHKVLALDLDNTLWQGVIGEDGVKGVVPNVEFQKRIKAIKDRGAVLAVLSKNNAEDVAPVWDDPRMVLKKDDFVAFGINWDDKAANLKKIARDLNVGTDALVFVDDNPAERAQMRAVCPEVCVADWPAQLEVYFPAREMTAEDAQKTAQYQAEAARKSFAVGMSVEDYLKGLEIWTQIRPIREDEIPRVAQLSQKTNQFNVCTNRYSEEDIRRYAVSDDHLLVTLHAGDRFGDQGLVAFVLVSISQADKSATILDWVMSCRTMNRRIEFVVQTEVERLLLARQISKLFACWKRTAKNAPVEDLFEKFGFTLKEQGKDEKNYERILA